MVGRTRYTHSNSSNNRRRLDCAAITDKEFYFHDERRTVQLCREKEENEMQSNEVCDSEWITLLVRMRRASGGNNKSDNKYGVDVCNGVFEVATIAMAHGWYGEHVTMTFKIQHKRTANQRGFFVSEIRPPHIWIEYTWWGTEQFSVQRMKLHDSNGSGCESKSLLINNNNGTLGVS